MLKGVAGYTAQTQKDGVLLKRCYAGVTDSILAKDFDIAADWLTAYYPNSFHIVWDLASFTSAIFSLLPLVTQEKLHTETRVFVNQYTKIFSVDRWFGLTITKPIRGNFYEKRENNFFGISHWLPSGTPIPTEPSQVAQYGDDVLAGLERMSIDPDKLTSPVGVFADELRGYELPTIYSNPDIEDACGYCIPMMRYEWRSAFRLGFCETAYSYDMISAYGSFIANLPDTDKCRIQFSDQYIKTDWAIVRGEIEVDADISPLVYSEGEGYINPKGKWQGYFTKEEATWLLRRQLGEFKMIDGYFIDWLSPHKPYQDPVSKLFSMRLAGDDMVNNLAKKMSQGISGKLDQDNEDGTLGELYNPLLAAMTRSRCRLSVADFIYNNALLDNVLAVQVDGVITDKQAHAVGDGSMGSWRLDTTSPALIVSKGEVWKPDKKPLNIAYDDLVSAIREHPNRTSYKVGNNYIDLSLPALDADREYDSYPKTGGNLLSKVYYSKACTIRNPCKNNCIKGTLSLKSNLSASGKERKAEDGDNTGKGIAIEK